VCGVSAPIELHHVAGERQAPDTVPVCLNCHGILSHFQRYWDPNWQRVRRPDHFLLQGYSDLLHLMDVRGSRVPASVADGEALPYAATWALLLLALVLMCLALRCGDWTHTDDSSDLVEPWRYP
jgi:hypothetical protein